MLCFTHKGIHVFAFVGFEQIMLLLIDFDAQSNQSVKINTENKLIGQYQSILIYIDLC